MLLSIIKNIWTSGWNSNSIRKSKYASIYNHCFHYFAYVYSFDLSCLYILYFYVIWFEKKSWKQTMNKDIIIVTCLKMQVNISCVWINSWILFIFLPTQMNFHSKVLSYQCQDQALENWIPSKKNESKWKTNKPKNIQGIHHNATLWFRLIWRPSENKINI